MHNVVQGELGAQGLVGPRGPPGEGLPGSKVSLTLSHVEIVKKKGVIHFQNVSVFLSFV